MPMLSAVFSSWGTAGRDRVFPRAIRLLAAAVIAVGALPAASIPAAETPGSPADVAAIRAAALTYREALAAGDAAAVQAAWTADGDIVDGWGNRLKAQDMARLDTVASATGGPRPEFHLGETQLRFIAADVAVEDGTVDVVLPGMQTPIQGWFSALWVRQAGGWKLAGLRESERPVGADADMLADLDWMVGDWVLQVEGAEQQSAAMELSVRWDPGRAFLIREARVPVTPAGPDIHEVHQRIGWDPLVRRIRSWSFSSDGSRSEATWFRDGDSWIAEQTAVLPTGQQEMAVNIYSYDGQDRCIWRTLPEALESDEGRPTRAIWVRKPKGVAQ